MVGATVYQFTINNACLVKKPYANGKVMALLICFDECSIQTTAWLLISQ